MALYRTAAAAGLLTVPAGQEAPAELPAKVARNAGKYLPLAGDEELLLLVDETLLQSGSEGIAVTTLRLLAFDKAKLKLNLPFAGLEKIDAADRDGTELVITRSGGRTLRLRINRATRGDVERMAEVIRKQLDDGSRAESAWQCPTCGPGLVIYVPRARYALGSSDAQIMLTARDLHVCKQCGAASLQIEDPSVLRVDSIDGAELRGSRT